MVLVHLQACLSSLARKFFLSSPQSLSRVGRRFLNFLGRRRRIGRCTLNKIKKKRSRQKCFPRDNTCFIALSRGKHFPRDRFFHFCFFNFEKKKKLSARDSGFCFRFVEGGVAAEQAERCFCYMFVVVYFGVQIDETCCCVVVYVVVMVVCVKIVEC